MKFIIKIINSINKSMVWITGTLIFIMSMAIFYSVVMRYLFNNPQSWTFDLIGLSTGIAALLSGGYASLTRQHVRVDIFFDKFSTRTKSIVDVATAFFWVLISGILIWKGTESVLYYYEMGIRPSTGLGIPNWIQWLMVPIGGLLLFLQEIVHFINNIYIIFSGNALYDENLIEESE